MTPLPNPLRGIIPPLITPLTENGALDEPSLERLIEHLLKGGVHGLFVLGTTGEFASLPYAVRREVITATCRYAQGRVPVLVGVTDTVVAESVALAEHAAAVGATALVVSTPYYFPISDGELIAHYARLVPRLPLPVFLYSIPSCSKVKISRMVLEEVLAWPQVAGFKDSSGDMSLFHQVQVLFAAHPTKSFLTGVEVLLAESVLMGAHGGICGGANLLPRLYVAVYDAAAAGDRERLCALQARLVEVTRGLYHIGPPETSYLRGLKWALSAVGLCGETLAEPLAAFNAAERAQAEAHLRQLRISPETLQLTLPE